MAGKSDFLEAAWLELLLNGTPIANIADNAASAPLTNLYVSLHTADPTDAGNQSASEAAYTGYARSVVARNPSSKAWGVTTVSGTTKAVPNAAINFPACTAGTGTATHFAIGTAASGTNNALYTGAITNPIAYSAGVTPSFTTSSMISED